MKRELDEDDPLGGSVALPHAEAPAAKAPRVDEAVAPPPAILADARAPSLADAFELPRPAIKFEPAPLSDAPESDLPPAIQDPVAPEHDVPKASPTEDEHAPAPAAQASAAPAPAGPVAPVTADGPSRDPDPPPSVSAPAPAAARQPYPRDPHARWRAIQTDKDPFTRVMLDHLRRAESTEPYHQVGDKWRREPWEPNPYESIGPGFVVARDMPQPDADVVLAKLDTDLNEGWMDLPPDPPPPPPDETPCMVCGRVDGEEDFVLCDGCPKGGHYACLGMPAVPTGDWFCPECVRAGKDTPNGDAATPTARAPAPPPIAARAPAAPPRWENRRPLRLGVDVEERPMWGMDCYTRVAVNAALSRAPSFAGDDADARSRRELFFSKLLMPAVHTMGVDGWDLAAATRKVRANAAARGNEGVVAGCDCVLRAIHEVDEANIDTVPPPKPPKGQRAAAAARARAASKKANEAKGPRIPPGVTLKKPLGSYMLFAADARGAIAAEHPEFGVTEIAKELGARWKKLGADVRAAYDARAKEAKRKYEEVDLPAAIEEAEAAEAAALKAEAEALKAEEEKRAAEKPPRRRRRRRCERREKNACAAAADTKATSEATKSEVKSEATSPPTPPPLPPRLRSPGIASSKTAWRIPPPPPRTPPANRIPNRRIRPLLGVTSVARRSVDTSASIQRVWAWCASAPRVSRLGRTCRITSASCTRLGGGTSARTPSRNANPVATCPIFSTSPSSVPRRTRRATTCCSSRRRTGARSRLG